MPPGSRRRAGKERASDEGRADAAAAGDRRGMIPELGHFAFGWLRCRCAGVAPTMAWAQSTDSLTRPLPAGGAWQALPRWPLARWPGPSCVSGLLGELVATNSHSHEAGHVQAHGRLGQPRRLDAALGAGAGALRRPASRFRATCRRGCWRAAGGAGADLLGFLAFLLFTSNPFERCCRRRSRAGAQPAAAGPRPRLPPAPALPRLCRLFGYLQLCRRRAAEGAVGPAWARGMRPWVLAAWVFLTIGHHARQLLGLLRAWLGRLVVLGPGRKCLADALAGRHGAAAFGERVMKRGALPAWTMLLALPPSR